MAKSILHINERVQGRHSDGPRTNVYWLFAVMLVGAIASGCAERQMYSTSVISIPPGARIEVDNDYIGDAPLQIEWQGWTPERFFTRNHTVTATSNDRQLQTKYFRGEDSSHVRNWADPIPKTILFDFGSPKNEPPRKTYTTKVVSEPPGARIEVNDEYRGEAPLELQWQNQTGYFETEVVIRAMPVLAGQQIHERFFKSSDQIPKTILFDMRLVSPGKPYRPTLSRKQETGDQNKKGDGN